MSTPVAAQRFAAQLLTGTPADHVPAVVERLLAVQAQDGRGARLAIRARARGVSAGDVDRCLADGSLVVSWLNRGTLHLVRREDYWWLHRLTAPQLVTGNARRLAQEGVGRGAADRGVAVIKAACANGPVTRQQLRERVQAAGVPVEGQALVHILALATMRGLIVRGPMQGARQAYVLARDWLGRPPRFNLRRALAQLARRFLAGHAPATDRDLAKWAGLPVRTVRSGLAAVSKELRVDAGGLISLKQQPLAVTEAPPPLLLGAFEPVLMGWESRSWVLGEREARVVSGGIFRPFAIADGRAVGTWRLEPNRLVLTPFEEVSADVEASLRHDASDVLRYLGVTEGAAAAPQWAGEG